MPLVDNGRHHMAKATLGEAGLTAFNNANARIGVGNGDVAFSAAHSDLQGASKISVGMEPSFPTAYSTGTGQTQFKSVFGDGVAEFTWYEWGIFNGVPGTGTMLCRKHEAASLGTKGAGQVWTVTATIQFNTA